MIGIARWATGPEDPFITNQLVAAATEFLTETCILFILAWETQCEEETELLLESECTLISELAEK